MEVWDEDQILTNTDQFQRIVPPLVFRVYIGAFATIWCGGLLAGGIVIVVLGPWVAAAVPIVMIGGGGVLLGRVYRKAVIPVHDGLVIRNVLRTRLIARGDIRTFRIDSMRWPPGGHWPSGHAVYLATTRGRQIPLEATFSAGLTSRSRSRLAVQFEQLSAWLEQTGS